MKNSQNKLFELVETVCVYIEEKIGRELTDEEFEIVDERVNSMLLEIEEEYKIR